MSRDLKHNGSGCLDLTAYEALRRIELDESKGQRTRDYRPLVFICSPLAGDVPTNTEKARRYCRFAVQKGAIPFAPHLLFPQFLDDLNPEERRLGIFFGLVLMGKCSEVWVFGHKWSHGMRAEIEKAKGRGLPIRYFGSQCEEVFG